MSKSTPIFFIDGGKVGVMIGEHRYCAPPQFIDQMQFPEIEKQRLKKEIAELTLRAEKCRKKFGVLESMGSDLIEVIESYAERG